MSIKIEVYAILKDYFPASFTLETHPASIEALLETLKQQQPKASNILAISRFAVSDAFVNAQYQIQPNDIISIIPPSSGG